MLAFTTAAANYTGVARNDFSWTDIPAKNGVILTEIVGRLLNSGGKDDTLLRLLYGNPPMLRL